MMKRILVGLAGTTYTPVAIERTVTLAQTQDAEVTGVTVLDARRVRSLGGAVPPPREAADAIRHRRMAITEARIAQSILIRLVGAGVRPRIAVSEKFRSIARVLLAYRGSMESAKAMKRFVQMRLWPGAELKIVTFHPSDEKAYELLRAAEDYCRAHGFSVCHQSNPGDPKVLLLAAATLWQADMIVMGNSARSVLLRRVLGDTLLGTLRNTTIPLFLAQ